MSLTRALQGKQHSDTQVLWTEAFYWNNGKQGDYFFLDTPTVRPRRPVVLVCWPRTRRLQGKEKTALKSSCLNSYRRINCETGLKLSAPNLLHWPHNYISGNKIGRFWNPLHPISAADMFLTLSDGLWWRSDAETSCCDRRVQISYPQKCLRPRWARIFFSLSRSSLSLLSRPLARTWNQTMTI